MPVSAPSIVASALLVLGCVGQEPRTEDAAAGVRSREPEASLPGEAGADTSPPESPSLTSPSSLDSLALFQAAETVVGFLRGERDFREVRLAPRVRLRVADEGGGDAIVVDRDSLAEPGRWRVPNRFGTAILFAPPDSSGELEIRPGAHFRCLPSDLSGAAPELAGLPHVGVRLRPSPGASCLETWNLTLVFDPGMPTPTLIAAVYDQWEW